MIGRNTEKSSQKNDTFNWLSTFNEIAIVLVLFFVFIFAISSVDSLKYNKFTFALKKYLSFTKQNFVIEEEDIGESEKLSLIERINFHAVKKDDGESSSHNFLNSKKFNKIFESDIFTKTVDLIKNVQTVYTHNINNMFTVSVGNKEIFKNETAEFTKNGYYIFDTLANLINSQACNMRIEDHSNEYLDETKKTSLNWALSIERTTKVIEYFIEECKIRPQKISGSGYAGLNFDHERKNTLNERADNRIKIVIAFSEVFKNVK